MTEPLTLAQRLRRKRVHHAFEDIDADCLEAANEIDRLHDANKALTGEREMIAKHVRDLIPEGQNKDQADSVYGVIGCIVHFNERATAAEAKLAKVEAFAAKWHCICQVIATILDLPEPDADFAAIVRDKFDRLSAELAEARAHLEWYGENARLARLIHSEGDAGRHALAADGGKRARSFLASEEASHAE